MILIDGIELFSNMIINKLANYISINENNIPMIIATYNKTDDKKHTNNRIDEIFPITLEMPTLSERPLIERYKIIEKIVCHEAKRIKTKIQIDSELLYCLLLYKCKNNINDLKKHIRQGCANAYARETDRNGEVKLYISDFDLTIRKGLIYFQQYKEELDAIIRPHITYCYDVKGNRTFSISENKEEKDASIEYSNLMEEKKNIAILFISHGSGIANKLAETASKFTGDSNVYSIDAMFGIPDEELYEQIRIKFKEMSEYKAVLVVHDSKKIRQIIYIVSNETKIDTREIYFPISSLVIEWTKKSKMPYVIDELEKLIINDIQTESSKLKKVIVALSTKEENTASQIQDYLNNYNSLHSVEILAIAITDREQLKEKLFEIMENGIIECIVGTYNPDICKIPFVPISQILGVQVDDISEILLQDFSESNAENWDIEKEEIYRYLVENLENIDMKKMRNKFYVFIDEIKKRYVLSHSTEIGLTMHVACTIDRIAAGENVPNNLRKEIIISKYINEYRELRKLIKPLEKTLQIIIPDDELVSILIILKKINVEGE